MTHASPGSSPSPSAGPSPSPSAGPSPSPSAGPSPSPSAGPSPSPGSSPSPGHGRQYRGPLSGRQAEAARNDQRILESARAVFIEDPGAPITAVAKHAGVGISALYTRYASKEDLLRTLCTDGLVRLTAGVETALEQAKNGRDHWQVLADFMRNMVDADTSSLTRALAGKFTPTPDMFTLANHSSELMNELFGLVRDVLRPGVVLHDLSLIFELVAVIKGPTPDRTSQLRHRYLALVLDGLRARDREELPGPPPTWQELSERWIPGPARAEPHRPTRSPSRETPS